MKRRKLRRTAESCGARSGNYPASACYTTLWVWVGLHVPSEYEYPAPRKSSRGTPIDKAAIWARTCGQKPTTSAITHARRIESPWSEAIVRVTRALSVRMSRREERSWPAINRVVRYDDDQIEATNPSGLSTSRAASMGSLSERCFGSSPCKRVARTTSSRKGVLGTVHPAKAFHSKERPSSRSVALRSGLALLPAIRNSAATDRSILCPRCRTLRLARRNPQSRPGSSQRRLAEPAGRA